MPEVLQDVSMKDKLKAKFKKLIAGHVILSGFWLLTVNYVYSDSSNFGSRSDNRIYRIEMRGVYYYVNEFIFFSYWYALFSFIFLIVVLLVVGFCQNLQRDS